MAFHLAHIRDYERFLVIDIGNYRVRAAAYSVETSQLKELGYATIRQNRKNFSQGMIADMQGVAKTIEQAMVQSCQSLEEIPQDVIISFSSHDFLFDTVTTEYMRADATSTLTMQELDTMIKRIESASHARARQKSKARFGFSDDIRLISSTITSITIDGKRIVNPVGFMGGKIALTVLNVFAPSSEFNILRSIIASLGRKVISLIPTPLVLPKIIEQTDYIDETICYLDVGYSQTTVMVVRDNIIQTFETFPVGARLLMEMIREKCNYTSLLAIENILCSESAILEAKNAAVLDDFFEYILDMLWAFLQDENIEMTFDSLLVHGHIFENSTIFKKFGSAFEKTATYAVKKHRLNMMVSQDFRHSESVTYGLALTASELLLVKKDPLIRILRYVLYDYE